MAKTSNPNESFAERLARMAASPKPLPSTIQTALNENDMRAIGYIIVQWSIVEAQVKSKTDWFRQSSKVPEDLKAIEVRQEFKHRLAYLRLLAEAALEGTRENAFELFVKNLDRIGGLKGIRDKLAHGAFNANEGVEGVSVHYKGRTSTISHTALERAAKALGECAGFFGSFETWLNAEASQKALQQISLGPIGFEILIETPEGPVSPQGSWEWVEIPLPPPPPRKK